ncbi:MAG: hypothetical protein AAB656_02595 [Patescibacteria group bacterium]
MAEKLTQSIRNVEKSLEFDDVAADIALAIAEVSRRRNVNKIKKTFLHQDKRYYPAIITNQPPILFLTVLEKATSIFGVKFTNLRKGTRQSDIVSDHLKQYEQLIFNMPEHELPYILQIFINKKTTLQISTWKHGDGMYRMEFAFPIY